MVDLKNSESSALAVHPGALGDLVLFGRLIESLAAPVTLVTSAGRVTLRNARIASVGAAAPRPGQTKASEQLTFTFQEIEFEFL